MSVKRLANYSGLASGQGPQTFSSSPLWSPYGPYAIPSSMGAIQLGAIHTNPQHMGAIHMGAIHTNPQHMGAIQLGGFHGEGDESGSADDKSLMGQLKGFYDELSAIEIMGYSLPVVAAVSGLAYYFFFRKGAAYPLLKNPKRRKVRKSRSMRRVRRNPLRMRRNRFSSTPAGKEKARQAALIRWGKKKGGQSYIDAYLAKIGIGPVLGPVYDPNLAGKRKRGRPYKTFTPVRSSKGSGRKLQKYAMQLKHEKGVSLKDAWKQARLDFDAYKVNPRKRRKMPKTRSFGKFTF